VNPPVPGRNLRLQHKWEICGDYKILTTKSPWNSNNKQDPRIRYTVAMFLDKLYFLSEKLSRFLFSEYTNVKVLKITKKGRYIRNFHNVGRFLSNSVLLTVVNCNKRRKLGKWWNKHTQFQLNEILKPLHV